MAAKGSPKRRWLVTNRYLIVMQQTSLFVNNAFNTKTRKFNWHLHLFATGQSVRLAGRPRNRISMPRKEKKMFLSSETFRLFLEPKELHLQ
jgi:hypothetical protein